MSGDFIMFICNDMESAWIAQLCADGEREMAAWERDEDRDHEEQLARDAVADDTVDAWPSYADSPVEVVESEVIEDANLFGMPIEDDMEDFDDEMTVEAFNAEVEQ